MELTNSLIAEAMTIKLEPELPKYPDFVEGIRRAPDRGPSQKKRPRWPFEMLFDIYRRNFTKSSLQSL